MEIGGGQRLTNRKSDTTNKSVETVSRNEFVYNLEPILIMNSLLSSRNCHKELLNHSTRPLNYSYILRQSLEFTATFRVHCLILANQNYFHQ